MQEKYKLGDRCSLLRDRNLLKTIKSYSFIKKYRIFQNELEKSSLLKMKKMSTNNRK